MTGAARVEIEYCTQCRWLLRATWMAQELLTTFSTDIGELALVPGTGGIFEIRIDDRAVWSRSGEGRFPEIKELKQLVRDRIAPARTSAIPIGNCERKQPDRSTVSSAVVSQLGALPHSILFALASVEYRCSAFSAAQIQSSTGRGKGCSDCEHSQFDRASQSPRHRRNGNSHRLSRGVRSSHVSQARH
jgi:selenoprotein W-related protein